MTHSMHHRFDQYTKNLLRDTLELVSKMPETEVEVLAATQKIDVFATPDPLRENDRPRLGLLGELSRVPSMFEAFSQTPELRRMRRCLSKQLAWHHEQERRARAAASGSNKGDGDATSSDMLEIVPFPRLVVITPGHPETALDMFGATNVRPGVYSLVAGLCTLVVVVAELPETRETLLVRLMGDKRARTKAIADLKELSRDAWEHCIAMPLLVHFQLDLDLCTTKDEGLMSAEIRAWFEDYKKQLRNEGFDAGRNEGFDAGRNEERNESLKRERALLLRQLHLRFGDLPAAAIGHIEQADVALLDRWFERFVSAQSLDDVFRDTN